MSASGPDVLGRQSDVSKEEGKEAVVGRLAEGPGTGLFLSEPLPPLGHSACLTCITVHRKFVGSPRPGREVGILFISLMKSSRLETGSVNCLMLPPKVRH